MSRRFSDEPINLIHRIPTPEQMSAARPLMKMSFGEKVAETLRGWARAAADLLASVARTERAEQAMIDAEPASGGGQGELANEPIDDAMACVDEGREPTECDRRLTPTGASSFFGEEATDSRQLTSVPQAVQPEEVAELRSFLLRQQQDIARLSIHIQELKSLVVSQQQVLVYLGKELEVSHTQLPAQTAVAAAPPKRNRTVREKTPAKEKPTPRKGTSASSLNL